MSPPVSAQWNGFGTNKQNPNKCLRMAEKPKHISYHKKHSSMAVKTKSRKTGWLSALAIIWGQSQIWVNTWVLVENKTWRYTQENKLYRRKPAQREDPCCVKNGLCVWHHTHNQWKHTMLIFSTVTTISALLTTATAGSGVIVGFTFVLVWCHLWFFWIFILLFCNHTSAI